MKLKRLTSNSNLEFYAVDLKTELKLPLYESKISAGFPSPADDYIELKLDLNEHLIRHPSATFFVKVKGNSMQGDSIFDGDMLIVDRSLEVKDNDVVVCILNGEFTVKRVKKAGDKYLLIPSNPQYKTIEVSEGADFQVWGVVAYTIHKP